MQTVSWCRRVANVPSEECENAFHQLEETQQLFACAVSVETVPNKIWNQEGSLNIATSHRVHQQLVCTQNSVLDLVMSGRHAADTTPEFRADAVVTLNVRSLVNSLPRAMTSSCGELETLPRIRERGIQSPPCSTLVGTSGRQEGDEDR